MSLVSRYVSALSRTLSQASRTNRKPVKLVPKVNSLEERVVMATAGSDVWLINKTPFTFKAISTTGADGKGKPYEIDWKMPAVVKPGEAKQAHQEWDNGLFTQHDANAMTTYKLVTPDGQDTDYKFGIAAYYTDLHTVQNPVQKSYALRAINLPGDSSNTQDTIVRLEDRSTSSFTISYCNNQFFYGKSQPDWMQKTLPVIGDLPLSQISIPGSHDAGMSRSLPAWIHKFTVTQTQDILGQLNAGARYFDIRPVTNYNYFTTGHYTGNFGSNGQNIDSIIQQVNAFTEDHKELIILNLSHDLDPNSLLSSPPPLDNKQYETLLKQLSTLNNLYVAPRNLYNDDGSINLQDLQLKSFIGDGKAAVIVIVQPSNPKVTIPADLAGQGFYGPGSFPVYDSYSNTSDIATMSLDQLKKMSEQKLMGNYFLLSWTLTQTTGSVLVGARMANSYLGQDLGRVKISPKLFPNIIYTDNVNTNDFDAQNSAVYSVYINATNNLKLRKSGLFRKMGLGKFGNIKPPVKHPQK